MSDKDEKKKAMLKALFGEDEAKLPKNVEFVTDDDLADFVKQWVREEPDNPENAKLLFESAEGYYECDVVANYGPAPVSAKVTYAEMKGMPSTVIFVAPIICCTTCMVRGAMFHAYAIQRNLSKGHGPIRMKQKH